MFNKQLMNMTEAAAYVGVSYSMMQKWVKAGLIPVRKFGRSYVMLKCHVDHFLESLSFKPL